MSTRNNRSNRKKGKVRRWLDSLLCVSSPEDPVGPPTQQRPSSHASLPLEPIQDAHTDAPNNDNTEQQAPLHASPPAEPTQSADVDSVNDENAPLPTSQSPSRTGTPVDTSGVKSGAWEGLRASLKTLRDTPAMFGPLVSAASVLVDCFDTIEVAARNQQDYEHLATELDTLAKSLVTTCKGGAPSSVTDCVKGIAIVIKREAEEIENKVGRGTGRRMVMANADGEDLVRRYRRIESLFRQLQTNIGMSTWAITNELMVASIAWREMQKSRLADLNAEKKATYNSTLSTSTSRRTCTEGTRVSILSELERWVSASDQKAVYWMSGMAGTGKTTIACTFAKWLETEKLLAASFFCTRTSADCRDVTRIVPTVAYQLARYCIPFQSALCDVLGNDPDLGTKDIRTQFERLLVDPLKTIKNDIPSNLVVVIDALDECDDQRGVEQVLDMLFKHASQLPIKFFVTSRPEAEIYTTMTTHARLRAAIYLHDIEKSLVRADIELYLKQELSSTIPGLPNEVLKQLVDRSGVLFIYAATLVRYIRPGTGKANSRERLNTVLGMTAESGQENSQIDKLYTAILKSALDDEELEASEKEAAQAVLRTVLFAQEPISLETIGALSGIDNTHRVECALNGLRSVLHHSEATKLVTTLHASFPDFMFSQARSGQYHCDVKEHSPGLTSRCFGVMKDQLRFNICDLPSSFIRDSQVDNIQHRIKTKISSTLAYACRYWPSHLAQTRVSEDMVVALKEFVSDRLLFWMEVMCLRRELLFGIHGWLAIKRWITASMMMMESGSESSELRQWVEDAINFCTSYASSPASQSTPHIYISCLPFCPRSSSVYTHYWHRMQGLLELKGSLMDRRETAAVATWNIGELVWSVAYSVDGSRVATGCSDPTVNIRDAYDGTVVVGPLQAHTDHVHSVVFSRDGRLLASGSEDRTIRVWDVRTGSLVAGPFQGHTWYVNSVSFSPDSKRIVSGSFDNTIYIWNTVDGTQLCGPLQGHTDSVRSVTFSPDGTLIASASDDKTIRLWRSDDGTPAASPLQGHIKAVRSVVFSPDGTLLLSGSEDMSVRVWRVSDGSAVTTPFRGHTDTVQSVTVSPDGTLVASGSYDKTVRVWRIADGSLAAGPFVGHTGTIMSVGYSPDGTRVISGSRDRTVRVWNVRKGIVTPASDHALPHIRSLWFSPDNGHVFTKSNQGEMQMWDVSNGTSRPAPPDIRLSRPLSSSTFPKSLYTAQTNNHGELVQLVRKDNGTVAAGPFDPIPRMLRFTDSAHVILVFDDGTIQGISLQTGEAVFRLCSARNGQVDNIAVCSDGSLLASVDNNAFPHRSLRVWSTTSPILEFRAPAGAPSTSGSSQTLSDLYDGCRVDWDGWLINSRNDLLLWLPVEIADTGLSPFVSVIVTMSGTLEVPKQWLVAGQEWGKCYARG
ncbi:Vegetative incompatibility protein HET-E-1 [Rhizoctonia solani]|uniref:Vegetative incompatibility protein HET-E-1 n=1 Tax=Rhizoctonia solani TaxID=456999 RepID=A0A8H8P264_9AGAM|nr:Vegetative incompatibility protein HET-E-1 [Rhizoctonia solani]QRW22463.1 Vegetative incompatibility protein HET-E-1 [Rhizoctonia solani]